MKKRILSLMMALCMVVLALPFAAAPIVAAGKEGFTTKLALGEETWPSFSSGTAFKNFNGNWAMGYFKDGVYYQHYDFDKGSNVVTSSNAWNNTGVFLESGQMILTQGGTSFSNDAAAFYAQATFKGEYLEEDERNTVAGVMAYTAPYTGTVDLDIYSMFGVDRQTNNIGTTDSQGNFTPAGTKTKGAYFAIFVNGEMVWPTKGGQYSNVDDWMLFNEDADGKKAIEAFHTAVDAEGGKITIDVSTRDVIQFAAALAPWCTSYFYMAPQVTYHDGYKVVPEAVTQSLVPTDHDWPSVALTGGTWDLKQTSELWTMASFDTASGAITPFKIYTKTNAGNAFAHHVDETVSGNNFIPKNGGIVLSHPTKSLIGAITKSTSETLRAAYVKESIANGKLTVSLQGIGLANAVGQAAKNASAKLKVFVNGELKATALIETDAAGNLKATPSATVDVARGDVVAIVPDEFPSSVAYVTGTPIVSYSNITSFMNTTPAGENDIALEKINVVVNGTIDLVFNAFATGNVYEKATDVTLYLWDNTVAGAKTPANAIAAIPMSMNTTLFSYEARYNGFAIKELADELTARVVAMDGTEELCSAELEVVPADIAYEDYAAATDKKMQTLYANLLNYAAYAQVYFGHNTDNLANAKLPVDLKTLDYDMLYDAQFAVTKPTGTAGVSDSEIGSFSLILDNTISIRAYIDRYITEMADTHGFYFQYADTLIDCYASVYKDRPADENLSLIIDNIGAHEMSELHYFRLVVTYQMKVGESIRDRAYYGYAMSYSVESYVSRMLDSTTPGLEDLVRAMMEFGKAAAAVY